MATSLFFSGCGKTDQGGTAEAAAETAAETAAEESAGDSGNGNDGSSDPQTDDTKEGGTDGADRQTENENGGDGGKSLFSYDKQGGSDTDGSEDPESGDGWGSAYIKYLDENPPVDGEYTYALIYVDEDDIPEMVINSQYEAGGCQIVTWHKGKLDVLQTSRLYFTYIEHENLLNNEDGHMGYYYDLVYTIRDGEWTMLFNGEYSGFADDDSDDYDEVSGRYICTDYLIDGKKTDRKGYMDALLSVYDLDRSQPPKSYLLIDDLRSYLETGKYLYESHRYEIYYDNCTWEEAKRSCEEKGGYLACMTCDGEFELVDKLIRSELTTDYVFYVGAGYDSDKGWIWLEPGLTQRGCVNSTTFDHWLNSGPSYSDTLPDGTEVDEYCCEYMYRKSEDRFYLNDVTNDVPGLYPSFRGRIGYICEYSE